MAAREQGLGLLAVVVVLVLAVLLGMSLAVPQVLTFSFEGGLEGWSPDGTDLDHDGGELDWSITQSSEQARDGSRSLRFRLDNANDKGKIWIVRSFEAEPGTTHRVTVGFAFGSSDFGTVNLWRIIAGVFPEPPENADDLSPAFRGDTGNGRDSNVGCVWLDQRYTSDVRIGEDGLFWVVIGVWGTWETPRTYYIDDVRVAWVG